jgi:hypothetical protein
MNKINHYLSRSSLLGVNIIQSRIDYGNYKCPMKQPNYNYEPESIDTLTTYEREIIEESIEFLQWWMTQTASELNDNEWLRLTDENGDLPETDGSREKLNKALWQHLNRIGIPTATGLEWNTKNWQNFRFHLFGRENAVFSLLEDKKPYRPDMGNRTQSSFIHKRMKEAEADQLVEISRLADKAKTDSDRKGRKRKNADEEGYAFTHSTEVEFVDPELILTEMNKIMPYGVNKRLWKMMNGEINNTYSVAEDTSLYNDEEYKQWMINN